VPGTVRELTRGPEKKLRRHPAAARQEARRRLVRLHGRRGERAAGSRPHGWQGRPTDGRELVFTYSGAAPCAEFAKTRHWLGHPAGLGFHELAGARRLCSSRKLWPAGGGERFSRTRGGACCAVRENVGPRGAAVTHGAIRLSRWGSSEKRLEIVIRHGKVGRE